MQTVTVVLEGAIEHRDHTGAHGILKAGDVQWMTAGHGVLHSEMPHGNETAHTLQLWLNLPRKMKMMPGRYRDQRLADAPVRRTVEGGEVRVYAGRSGDMQHGHGSDYPMWLLEVRLDAGAKLVQEISPPRSRFLLRARGSGDDRAGRKRARAMSPGSSRAEGDHTVNAALKTSVACFLPGNRSTSRR